MDIPEDDADEPCGVLHPTWPSTCLRGYGHHGMHMARVATEMCGQRPTGTHMVIWYGDRRALRDQGSNLGPSE